MGVTGGVVRLGAELMKTAARYGLPALVLVIGCVMLFIMSNEAAVIGTVMIVAFALKVIFLSEVFRIGLTDGNKERDEEDAARLFLIKHGRWPDDVGGQ